MDDASTTGTSSPTCGKGLAHHGPAIDWLARFALTNADVLEAHLPMLDESDPASADEGAVYRALIDELRQAGTLLESAATRMIGAREMTMGRHVDSSEANAAMADAFHRFVDAESSLIPALNKQFAEHEVMLRDMSE